MRMRYLLRDLGLSLARLDSKRLSLIALIGIVFACCSVKYSRSKPFYSSGYFGHTRWGVREGLSNSQMTIEVDEFVDKRVKTGDLEENNKEDCQKEIIERSHKYYPDDILDTVTEKAYRDQLNMMREQSSACNKSSASQPAKNKEKDSIYVEGSKSMNIGGYDDFDIFKGEEIV